MPWHASESRCSLKSLNKIVTRVYFGDYIKTSFTIKINAVTYKSERSLLSGTNHHINYVALK